MPVTVSVESLSTLSVFDLAMATYPDRNVFGTFSFFLKEGGVSPGSTDDENELIRSVAERAVDKFAGIAANQ